MLLPLEDLLPRTAFLWGGGSSWTVPGMLLFWVCVNVLLAGQLLELGTYSWLPAPKDRADDQALGCTHSSQPLRAGNAEGFFFFQLGFPDLLIPWFLCFLFKGEMLCLHESPSQSLIYI